MASQNQLLLLEDVDDLGRSGDVVSVKPGYARNFLVPQKKAVVASKQTIRMQARLKEDRLKRALVDKADSEKLAANLENITLSKEVKVDPEGKMYGSVTALDIAKMLQMQNIEVEKRHIILLQAIKEVGSHTIELRLKEGVPAKIKLDIVAESSIVR